MKKFTNCTCGKKVSQLSKLDNWDGNQSNERLIDSFSFSIALLGTWIFSHTNFNISIFFNRLFNYFYFLIFSQYQWEQLFTFIIKIYFSIKWQWHWPSRKLKLKICLVLVQFIEIRWESRETERFGNFFKKMKKKIEI